MSPARCLTLTFGDGSHSIFFPHGLNICLSTSIYGTPVELCSPSSTTCCWCHNRMEKIVLRSIHHFFDVERNASEVQTFFHRLGSCNAVPAFYFACRGGWRCRLRALGHCGGHLFCEFCLVRKYGHSDSEICSFNEMFIPDLSFSPNLGLTYRDHWDTGIHVTGSSQGQALQLPAEKPTLNAGCSLDTPDLWCLRIPCSP